MRRHGFTLLAALVGCHPAPEDASEKVPTFEVYCHHHLLGMTKATAVEPIRNGRGLSVTKLDGSVIEIWNDACLVKLPR